MKNTRFLYYLVPLSLWILQAIYTFSSMNQLRGDEVFTIRDILPFAHRALAAAPGSNVTFYAAVMILYNLFGFSLWTPKFYRLGIQLISLFCLAEFLKKYFGEKKALLPLLTFGLSPTLLYWTVMEAPWGIDLQLFPICLFLIDTLNVKKKWTILTGPVLGCMATMLSWLSYPTFMFYLPFLAWLQIKKLMPFRKKAWLLLAVCGVSFLLPLLALYLYIIRRDILFYDPYWQRGLFTAGGTLMFDANLFYQSTVGIFVNLFAKATSYMFEVRAVDFSYIFPAVTFFFVTIFPLKFLHLKSVRGIVIWCFLTIFVNIILTGLTLDGSGMPGARRNTPILASFYGLFTITWYLVAVEKVKIKFPKLLAPGMVLSVLLVHHLLVYPINLFALEELSPWRDTTWMSLGETPQESVNLLVNQLQQHDLTLDCEKQFGVSYPICVYSTIYAILDQACTYNKLSCHNISARFPGYQNYQPLTFNFFAKDYWDK